MSTRIATIIIKDGEGRFFVHQRSPRKKKFPNYYGLGAGGHVEEGEDPTRAAQRELLEETQCDAPVRYLFTVHYREDPVDNTIYVHDTTIDSTIQPDLREWQWSGWMTQDEVDTLLTAGKLCPDTALFYQQYRKG